LAKNLRVEPDKNSFGQAFITAFPRIQPVEEHSRPRAAENRYETLESGNATILIARSLLRGAYCAELIAQNHLRGSYCVETIPEME
jgi:hypothetical protein